MPVSVTVGLMLPISFMVVDVLAPLLSIALVTLSMSMSMTLSLCTLLSFTWGMTVTYILNR